MSLLAATWTSAVATVLLVFDAVVAAFYARNAYREQSRQTGCFRSRPTVTSGSGGAPRPARYSRGWRSGHSTATIRT
jgi:hypothetical protein